MLFHRTLSLMLAMVAAGNVSAVGSLRAANADGDNNEMLVSKEDMSLFRSWTEKYNKVYDCEHSMMKKLKVWLHNHGKYTHGQVFFC